MSSLEREGERGIGREREREERDGEFRQTAIRGSIGSKGFLTACKELERNMKGNASRNFKLIVKAHFRSKLHPFPHLFFPFTSTHAYSGLGKSKR